jgi:hypothetical protein
VDIQVQVCFRADSLHCRNLGLASLALTIQASCNFDAARVEPS